MGPPPYQKPVDTMILRFGLTMTHRDAWKRRRLDAQKDFPGGLCLQGSTGRLTWPGI